MFSTLLIGSCVAMPNITVLLCAYREPFHEFEAAIRSVIFQTLPPNQLVVVDDSGEGRFKSLCQQLKIEFLDHLGIALTYVCNDINKGLVASLNLGLAETKGEYVARMDGDDISLPYRFQKQVSLLESGYDIVGGAVTLFDSKGLTRDITYPGSQIGLLYSLIRNNPIAHPVSMFKTKTALELNGYRDVSCAEDLDLWMRAYLAGYRISNCKTVLLLRRMHPEQLSSKHSVEQEKSTRLLRKAFVKRLCHL